MGENTEHLAANYLSLQISISLPRKLMEKYIAYEL